VTALVVTATGFLEALCNASIGLHFDLDFTSHLYTPHYLAVKHDTGA
jgi:hypothetical protein